MSLSPYTFGSSLVSLLWCRKKVRVMTWARSVAARTIPLRPELVGLNRSGGRMNRTQAESS
jgi:hypothetical protein